MIWFVLHYLVLSTLCLGRVQGFPPLVEDEPIPTEGTIFTSSDDGPDQIDVHVEDDMEIIHVTEGEREVQVEDDLSEEEVTPTMDMLKRNSEAQINITDTIFIQGFMKNCTKLLKALQKAPLGVDIADLHSSGFELMKTLENFGKNVATALGYPRKAMRCVPMYYDGLWMDVTTVNLGMMTHYHFPTQKQMATGMQDTIMVPKKAFGAVKSGKATIISTALMPFPQMTADFNKSSNSRVTKVGGWSDRGCRLISSNQTHTICKCNHLTDFSVLFRVTETGENENLHHRKVLGLITIIGCCITIAALAASLVVILIFRRLLKSDRNVIHFNLCLSLLIANVLFLFVEKAKENKDACLALSIALLFFFLAAFTWMLMEGIFIWIMLVKVFSKPPPKWFYFVVTWGISALVCILTASILKRNMVDDNYCWLPVRNGAIWAFVGPALGIILINFGVLLRSLFISLDHQKDRDATTALRTAAKLAILLMPILGSTWLLGIFSINEDTVVFQYIFTILNSLQGLFIFVLYIIYNKEVHYEYNRYKRRTASSSTSRLSSGNHGQGIQNGRFIQQEISKEL